MFLKKKQQKKKLEVEEQIEDSIDVETDIQALLEGEELSEDFTNKARTIFESYQI